MGSPQIRAGEIAEEVRAKSGYSALAVYDGSTAHKAFLEACKRIAVLEAKFATLRTASEEHCAAISDTMKEARREGARAGIEWQRRENGWKEIHATCSDGQVAAALGEVDPNA